MVTREFPIATKIPSFADVDHSNGGSVVEFVDSSLFVGCLQTVE